MTIATETIDPMSALADPASQRHTDLGEALTALKLTHDNAWDSRVPSLAMMFREEEGTLVLRAPQTPDATPWAKAYRQITGGVRIPWEYAQRMIAENRIDLAARNLNDWLHASEDARLVRGVYTPNGHRIRAFLSPTYRVLPPLPLIETAIEEVQTIAPDSISFADAVTSPERAVLRITSSKLRAELKVGDVVEGGVEIKMSDVGDGSVWCKAYTRRLVCLNGATSELTDWTRIRHQGNGDERFVHDRVRIGVRAAFSQFNVIVEQMQGARAVPVPDPILALSSVADRFEFSADRLNRMLVAFGKEPEATGFGIVQAVTLAAQSEPTAGGRLEMEAAGGALLEQIASRGFRFDAPSVN